MKKYLKIIIPLLVIGLLVFMGYKMITKIKHRALVAEQIKAIPAFSYQTIKGKQFTDKYLKLDIPTAFLYFNTECEHCQSEASQIEKNIAKFKNVQLVFVSFEKPEKIKAFAHKYKLLGYDTITFLCDSKVSFATTFDVNSLPSILLYDKNRQLIEKIRGQIKVDKLLEKIAL